eukprot:1667273-Rhodomonas_salina.1
MRCLSCKYLHLLELSLRLLGLCVLLVHQLSADIVLRLRLRDGQLPQAARDHHRGHGRPRHRLAFAAATAFAAAAVGAGLGGVRVGDLAEVLVARLGRELGARDRLLRELLQRQLLPHHPAHAPTSRRQHHTPAESSIS